VFFQTNGKRTEYSMNGDLVAQRLYGKRAGYEDLNDHDVCGTIDVWDCDGAPDGCGAGAANWLAKVP